MAILRTRLKITNSVEGLFISVQLYKDILDHVESYASANYLIMTSPMLSEDIIEMVGKYIFLNKKQ